MNQTKPNYPEKLIRGIKSKSEIKVSGNHKYVTRETFSFDSSDERGDGYEECSINWEDDDNAEEFTLKQIKNNDFTFKGGLVKIKKYELDLMFSVYLSDLIDYERKIMIDNIYHGNLLLKSDQKDEIKKQVRASLALLASKEIILRD